MIRNTETDLHALLDGLTDGEHIKATWKVEEVEVTAEGPVYKDAPHYSCVRVIRWNDGPIDPDLASVEVTRDEEVTVTRDDEKALHALLDSLENGETVTVEWRDAAGSVTITGKVRASGHLREMYRYGNRAMRLQDGEMHDTLHSVTVRRPVVQRWEREGSE